MSHFQKRARASVKLANQQPLNKFFKFENLEFFKRERERERESGNEYQEVNMNQKMNFNLEASGFQFRFPNNLHTRDCLSQPA